MKNKRLLLVLLGLCAFLWTHAASYKIDNLPSPKAKGQEFYVSNPDKVLLSSVEAEINALCTRLHKASEVELAVVAISRYDDSRYDGYQFAYRLFNRWGIGDKHKNTGVLLFLSRETREVQIITGDGIAGILPDGKCGEILDNNMDYLSNNNFNAGLLHICADIEELLMTDDHVAELMFGWKPKNTVVANRIAIWMVIGMILMVLLGWWGYKCMQVKPGQTKEEINRQTKGVRSFSGCLAFIFPIPILFFYLYYKRKSMQAQTIPLNCSKCGHAMNLLEKDNPLRNLSASQMKEESIGAYEFTVWQCPECGEISFAKHIGRLYQRFEDCPECGARAFEMTKREVVKKANYFHNGLQKNTQVCQCCGHTKVTEITLLKENTTSGRIFGSSGSGGGFSGSWGGGFSSGGGAGRRF